MGAESYWYYAKYQSSLNAVLQELREREFLAGRYNRVTPFPDFPITDESPAPGAQHDSMTAALEEASGYGDGTRSILDIAEIADFPFPFATHLEFEDAMMAGDEAVGELCCRAFPLRQSEILGLFGTDCPTHDMIESVIFSKTSIPEVNAFWDGIPRGVAKYIIVYEHNQPSEVFFAGYSFD
jgi:hypothetical protein